MTLETRAHVDTSETDYCPTVPRDVEPIQDRTVLEEAQAIVHGVRDRQYGHPRDHFARTARMVTAFLNGKLSEPLTAEEWGYCMVLDKISRQRGPSKRRDNLVDGAGYFGAIARATGEDP